MKNYHGLCRKDAVRFFCNTIGAEFIVAKTIPAFIQMTARYQVTPLTDDVIEERLASMGLETGMRYTF